MTTSRDALPAGGECIDEDDSVQRAAARMRELDIAALPVRGRDGRLHGVITDRDITTRCVALGEDPSVVTARDVMQGESRHANAHTRVRSATLAASTVMPTCSSLWLG